MKSLVEGLLCADTKDRFEACAVALQWGWLSVDENRKLGNVGPIPGGDTYLTPLNMTPLGEESRDG